RGLEGSAQRALFAFWREQLPRELGFESRQRRPPRDPVNAVLSLSFTLLYHEAIRQCLLHGLDPWLGLYHRLTPGRQSLACDLMEPLRPWIEAWVVDSFAQGLFDRRHFSVSAQGCLFGKAGRSVFYPQWYARQPQWGAQIGRYAGALGPAAGPPTPTGRAGAGCMNRAPWFLVSYDIADPRRLRAVHRLLRGCAHPLL